MRLDGTWTDDDEWRNDDNSRPMVIWNALVISAGLRSLLMALLRGRKGAQGEAGDSAGGPLAVGCDGHG